MINYYKKLSCSPTINNTSSISVINNPHGYKYLAFLSTIYICTMLFNTIMTNRYVGYDRFFILGGTLTSPFIFLLDNIIAEIYGFKLTRSIIFCGFTAQTLFVVLCQFILLAPSPSLHNNNNLYEPILGISLLRLHLSGCFAYLIATLFNTKILTQWKILLKGKRFWLRSLGACTISELIYSFIAILLMEMQSISLTYIFKIVAISYSIKVIYNIIFMIPSQLLVHHIRNKTNIDIYDFQHDFTPFKYFKIR